VGFELIKSVVILLALLGGLYLLLRFLKGRIMPGKGIIENGLQLRIIETDRIIFRH